MVQALAFAEIFLGLILADAGYKGVSVSQVVKGEAGAQTPPAGLGGTASVTPPIPGGESGSSPGETVPGGGGNAPSPSEIAKNRAFGPSPTGYAPLTRAKGVLEKALKRKVSYPETAHTLEKYNAEQHRSNLPPSSFETLTGEKLLG